MKLREVQVGQTYLTRIGEQLARVVVVERVQHTNWHNNRVQSLFVIRREGETMPLPKRRSAASLRQLPLQGGDVGRTAEHEAFQEALCNVGPTGEDT